MTNGITRSSERANTNRALMHEVAGLTNSQKHAVDRINTVVNELFKISGDTSGKQMCYMGYPIRLG